MNLSPNERTVRSGIGVNNQPASREKVRNPLLLHIGRNHVLSLLVLQTINNCLAQQRFQHPILSMKILRSLEENLDLSLY